MLSSCFFFLEVLHEEVLEEYRKIKQVCVTPDLWEVVITEAASRIFLNKGREIPNSAEEFSCPNFPFILSLQSSPNYYEEKYRCEYLHNKLSHIKRLIEEFDQRQAESWH